MNARPAPRRGFTLLELAMVLAVMVVLAGLAVPSLGARLERQRARSAAEALAADLNEARFEASRRGQALFVETRLGPQWCWTVATASGCECGAPAACRVHSAGAADHRGVQLVGGLAVRLDASGLPAETQSAAFETPHGERLRVELSTLGRTRLCVEKGHWPQLPNC